MFGRHVRDPPHSAYLSLARSLTLIADRFSRVLRNTLAVLTVLATFIGCLSLIPTANQSRTVHDRPQLAARAQFQLRRRWFGRVHGHHELADWIADRLLLDGLYERVQVPGRVLFPGGSVPGRHGGVGALG